MLEALDACKIKGPSMENLKMQSKHLLINANSVNHVVLHQGTEEIERIRSQNQKIQ